MTKNIRFNSIFSSALLAMVLMLSTGCQHIKKDSLSLWNDTAPAKQALTDYVKNVTNPKSADFIPEKERVAVFDLDGTLILETDPTYFDWLLFEHRVLDDPDYKATSEQIEMARNSREKGILPSLNDKREQTAASAYKDMTLNEFYNFVRKFMEEDQPGFIGMKRGDIFYRPMVEIVEYLVKNRFYVYICSGTDRLIVRPLIDKNLPYIPYSQIIGSDSTIIARDQGETDGLSYTFKKGDELVIGGKSIVKNLQMNKVSSIAREIGIQPVLAFGNSSTDASMVNYAINGNKHKALGFMLCSDDLEREYGNMEKAGKMYEDCEKYGWICISMKNDWKTIYGDNIKKRATASTDCHSSCR